MCNKMPLAIALFVILITAVMVDLYMVMEKKDEIVRPKPERVILSIPPEAEPYIVDRKQLKPWKMPEVHPCYQGAKVVFTVNGVETDYWQYQIEQEVLK